MDWYRWPSIRTPLPPFPELLLIYSVLPPIFPILPHYPHLCLIPYPHDPHHLALETTKA
jgi:hypothetical protein